MPIQALGPSGLYIPPPPEPSESAVSSSGSLAPEIGRGGESFAAAITGLLREANQDQVDASGKVIDLTVRGKGDIHDAMVAVESAESSFRLLMEMRNRLIEGVSRLLETQL
jgi:flagellar hook-basal body complex protein FliE